MPRSGALSTTMQAILGDDSVEEHTVVEQHERLNRHYVRVLVLPCPTHGKGAATECGDAIEEGPAIGYHARRWAAAPSWCRRLSRSISANAVPYLERRLCCYLTQAFVHWPPARGVGIRNESSFECFCSAFSWQ